MLLQKKNYTKKECVCYVRYSLDLIERERKYDRQKWLMFYLIDNFFDCTKSDYSGFPLIISTLAACISL